MKKKISVLLILFMLVATGVLVAQSGTVTISGLVVDAETRDPLAGANVAVRGMAVGSAANLQGAFTFGAVLDAPIEIVASFMGYKRQTITLRPGDTLTGLLFELEPDVIGTEAVVVTALGITREERSLGYAQQSIDAAALTETAETNLIANLSGKVAGVQITSSTSGMPGASARIQIRGVSTLTGDNQPLFVIDGVPIDNRVNASSSAYGGYVDFGNAASDINPNDIASINILKSANAAALYGARALNGVIEITTKSGAGAGLIAKKGIGVSYSSHMTMSNVDLQYNFQDIYGQGLPFSTAYKNARGLDPLNAWGQFAFRDGWGLGIQDGGDESWGAPMDGYMSELYQQYYGDHARIRVQGTGQPLLIQQYDSPFPDGTIDPSISSWDRVHTPWVSNPDNVKNFFETGMLMEHNLSVYGGDMFTNFRVSVTHTDQTGVMPNTDQKSNSVYLSGNIQVTDKLSVSGKANYVNRWSDNLMVGGYTAANPMQSMSNWFGRQVDLSWLKDNIESPEGRPYNWNFTYFDSPYWTAYKNTNSMNRHRMFGHVSADYQILDWITATMRIGTDWYRENQNSVRAKYSNRNPDGWFSESSRFNKEDNYDLFIRANREISGFNVTALVGANYRENQYQFQSTTVDGLIIPDLYAVANAAGTPSTNIYKRSEKHAGIYGRIGVNYNDYLFVEATGRNDWASTLPEDNRSYFYPSVGGSFVFSEFFEIDENKLFGKLRASWAKVGSSASPYSLAPVFSNAGASGQPLLGVPLFGVPGALPNPELRPEQKTSIEFGFDLKFLRNRLGFSATYYKENTTDQIMAIDISPSTGFGSKWINAGEIQNQGFELVLNATPVKSGKFSWDVDINWAKNINEVIELYEGVDALTLWGGSWGGLQFVARPGEKWGTLWGWNHQTYNGKPLVSAGGVYQREPGMSDLGSVLPDWQGGIRNSISYGNFRLSALVDASWGGVIYSVTNQFGYYAGVLHETVWGEDGVNAVHPSGDIRLEGAIIDGYQLVDGEYVENQTPVNARTWALYRGWPGLGGHGLNTYDATWVKLRSITLSYRVPSNITGKIGLLGATVSLQGRNLAILHKKVPHIDPETSFSAGIVQGTEQNQFPGARVFGFSLKLDL